MRALRELQSLVDEDAPPDVIGAARYLTQFDGKGIMPKWVGDILLAYAHKRQRQDRYGK